MVKYLKTPVNTNSQQISNNPFEGEQLVQIKKWKIYSCLCKFNVI